MSFHVDFILTRVVTKATVKGTIFTEHIGIEEVVKVWKSSYENIHHSSGTVMDMDVSSSYAFCEHSYWDTHNGTLGI